MDMGGVPVTDIHKSAPANARTTGSGFGRIILGGAKSNKRQYRNECFFRGRNSIYGYRNVILYLNFVKATCVTHVKSNLTCLPFKIY